MDKGKINMKEQNKEKKFNIFCTKISVLICAVFSLLEVPIATFMS